jgi:hypothetical protein
VKSGGTQSNRPAVIPGYIGNGRDSVAAGSNLKMEEICFSETSVDIQRTTRRYIPEGSTLRNHSCESIKCYTVKRLFKTITQNFVLFPSLLKPPCSGNCSYFRLKANKAPRRSIYHRPIVWAPLGGGGQHCRFCFLICSPEDVNTTNFRNVVISITSND